MKREVMEKWVHALRHGNYGQTYGYLREESDPIEEPGEYAYCALGVLCDVYVKEQCDGDWGSLCRPQSYGETPPPAVIEWAGLSCRDPDVNVTAHGEEEHYESISEINDAGVEFSKLASLIEEQWEKL